MQKILYYKLLFTKEGDVLCLNGYKKIKKSIIYTGGGIVLGLVLYLLAFGGAVVQKENEIKEENIDSNIDNNIEASANVKDYFIYDTDTVYKYTSEDSNIYIQDQLVVYKEDNSIQKKYVIMSLNIELDEVYTITNDEVILTYAEGEVNSHESLIDKEPNTEVVILKAPFEVGNTWQRDETSTSEITSMSKEITVPYGTFNAMEISTSKTNGDFRADYWVMGVGLVKTVFSSVDKGEMSSDLLDIVPNEQLNLPYARFDYNATNGQFVREYEDFYISTNPDYINLLETNLKKVAQEDYLPLLTPNTKINKIVISNEETLLNVDLSKDFINEINGYGTSMEQSIIDCLVDTLGNFYAMKEVIITIDGNVYQSSNLSITEPITVQKERK